MNYQSHFRYHPDCEYHEDMLAGATISIPLAFAQSAFTPK